MKDEVVLWAEEYGANVGGLPVSSVAQQLLLYLLLDFCISQVHPQKWLCFLRSFFKSRGQTCRGKENHKGKWKMCLFLLPLVVSAFQFIREKSQVQQRRYSSNSRVSLSERHFPDPLPLWCLRVELMGFFSYLFSFLFTFMCHGVKSCAPLFFVKLAVSHRGMAALAIEEWIQDKKRIQL